MTSGTLSKHRKLTRICKATRQTCWHDGSEYSILLLLFFSMWTTSWWLSPINLWYFPCSVEFRSNWFHRISPVIPFSKTTCPSPNSVHTWPNDLTSSFAMLRMEVSGRQFLHSQTTSIGEDILIRRGQNPICSVEFEKRIYEQAQLKLLDRPIWRRTIWQSLLSKVERIPANQVPNRGSSGSSFVKIQPSVKSWINASLQLSLISKPLSEKNPLWKWRNPQRWHGW